MIAKKILACVLSRRLPGKTRMSMEIPVEASRRLDGAQRWVAASLLRYLKYSAPQPQAGIHGVLLRIIKTFHPILGATLSCQQHFRGSEKPLAISAGADKTAFPLGLPRELAC